MFYLGTLVFYKIICREFNDLNDLHGGRGGIVVRSRFVVQVSFTIGDGHTDFVSSLDPCKLVVFIVLLDAEYAFNKNNNTYIYKKKLIIGSLQHYELTFSYKRLEEKVIINNYYLNIKVNVCLFKKKTWQTAILWLPMTQPRAYISGNAVFCLFKLYYYY